MAEPRRLPFHIDIPPDLQDIAILFGDEGVPLYLVGGAVRDAVMGKQPKDYDLATSMLPQDVADFMRINKYRVLEVGAAFGVIVVLTDDGGEYEIATFREDIGAGRRPDAVEFTTIEQDVQRRDLTINALFYDIEAGEIVDYVGGIDDIEGGVVRAVGNPTERFEEDPLRILRALRFAGRMGSEIDPETASAIDADNSLVGVSPERVRDEFLKGAKSAQSVPDYLRMVERFGLWDQVLPGLTVSLDIPEIRDPVVLLAVLLSGNEPKAVSRGLNELKYTGDEAKEVTFLLNFARLGGPEGAFRLKRQQPKSVTPERLLEFAGATGRPPMRVAEAFADYKPSVTGQQLLDQGLQGVAIGREMERLETEIFRSMM